MLADLVQRLLDGLDRTERGIMELTSKATPPPR